MQWTIEMDSSGLFVRVVTSGPYSIEGQIGMTEDLLSRPFWKPGNHALFDHRALDLAGATFDDMKAAGQNHIRNDERIGSGKSAILMESERDFGSARQFQLLTEEVIVASIRVFLDEEEAVAWLIG